MAIVCVRYFVPLVAVVDTEEGTVNRVVVEDEHVSKPGRVTDEEGMRDAPPLEVIRALEIVEKTMWPSWDYGW